MVEKLIKMRTAILLYTLFFFNIILIYSNFTKHNNRQANNVVHEMYGLLTSVQWEWHGVQIISISLITAGAIIGLKKIYEHKTMENKLEIFKSIYLSFFEMTPGAVFVFSCNKVLLTNSKAEEMFETRKIKDNVYFKELMQMVLDSHTSLNLINYKILDHNKMEHLYDIDTVNSFVGTQKIGVVVLKEKIEEDGEISELERVLPYHQEILAKMSHELRTPINILQGVLANSLATIEQLEDEAIKEKLMKDLAVFDRNMLRLLKLSENGIQLMEMDDYDDALQFKNCNVSHLIQNITDASMDYANKKKLKIELLDNMKSKYCAVDIDKFEKMILNLLSNAIKFGEQDSKILINIHESSRKLNIDICSKGNQIEPKEQEKMFKLFQQGENLLTRTHEGLGVGLHFVKKYAKMHGGKVGVRSDCEGNNVFSIHLPMYTNDSLKYVDVISEADIYRQKVKVEFSDI